MTYRLPEVGERFPSPDDVRRNWGSAMLRVGGLELFGLEDLADVGVPDPYAGAEEGAMVGYDLALIACSGGPRAADTGGAARAVDIVPVYGWWWKWVVWE
jgi:hypothetical protein